MSVQKEVLVNSEGTKMADLNTNPVKVLDTVGGNSPEPIDGQVNDSESDDERNDEAGAGEVENQGGRLEIKLLTKRKLLRDYSF